MKILRLTSYKLKPGQEMSKIHKFFTQIRKNHLTWFGYVKSGRAKKAYEEGKNIVKQTISSKSRTFQLQIFLK